ncbi:MAG: tetratricopeptide repeat protein [Candidatus Andersenbacteria bacterium]
MQIVLRYLPQALIVVALAVLVVVVVRKLPKTAKLEAELAAQKAAEAAGNTTGLGRAKKKRKLPPVLALLGPGLKKAGSGLARGSRTLGRTVSNVVVRGRLKNVLSIAARKRNKSQMVSASKIAAKASKDLTQKEQTILKLLKEAEDYARQSNWPAAEKVYIKVVALAPKTIEAYLGLGDLYLKQKNWNDAAESYKVALDGDDSNVTAWGNLGMALANKGEWVAAVDALQRAAKLDPGNAIRQATLGMAYLTIKEYKKATKAYREAVNHDRENMSHRVELAKAANLAGDKALAEEMLNAVLARDPLNEQAKSLLSEVKAKKELE